MAELQVRTLGEATLLEWTERGSLLSRAELRIHTLAHQSIHDRVCKLGAVFTPPQLRRSGHARQLVALATAYIHRLEVDLAILDCRRELTPLYASSSWQIAPTPMPKDSPSRPQSEEPLLVDMVLFCSDRALAAYAALTHSGRLP